MGSDEVGVVNDDRTQFRIYILDDQKLTAARQISISDQLLYYQFG